MASRDDYMKLMESRALPYVLHSEAGDVLPDRPLPYVLHSEAGEAPPRPPLADLIAEVSGKNALAQQIKKAEKILEGGMITNVPRPESTLEAWTRGAKNIWNETLSPMRRVGDAMLGKTTMDSYPMIDEINDPATMRLAMAKDILEGIANVGTGPTLLGKPSATGLSTFGGLRAKNPPQYSLSLLRELEAKGLQLGDDEWRVATGWHRGMEGLPRFEIDDSKLAINKNLSGNASEMVQFYKQVLGEEPNLSMFIDHDELYRQYPALKNVKINSTNDITSSTRGQFNEATNTISVRPDLSDNELKDTLIHEIQHWIQQKEGFARGGSPEGIAREFSDKYRQWTNFANAARYDELRKQYGPEDALNRLNIELQEEADIFGKVHEPILGTTAQDIKSLADKYGSEELRKQFNKMYEENPNLLSGNLSPELAYRKYQRLAGEIEARDAANRRTWPEDLRRAYPPDVRKDAIIRMEGGQAAQVDDLASKNIPNRPMLTMGDIEGMYPGGGKKLLSKNGIDYYETPDGIYALSGGKEVGFATPLSEDISQGFDVSVATEVQRKGIGATLFKLFRKQNPDYPTGGLTKAGRGMLEKLSRESGGVSEDLTKQVNAFWSGSQPKMSNALDDIGAWENEGGNALSLAKKIDEKAPGASSKIEGLEVDTTKNAFYNNLSPEAQKQVRWFKNNGGKSAVHANQKTGLSVDFNTSCPKRNDIFSGPCPYCYVEHGRVADKLLNMKGNKKAIGEYPYNREIAKFAPDLVESLNKDGGLRMFSFGDYRPDVDFKNVQMVLDDAKSKGLYIKAITKQPEFVRDWGNHPNMRINISTDNVPRNFSKNAPTIDQAVEWAAGRENIKIRAVALNPDEAEMFATDPRVNVVTLYHGLTNFNAKGERTNNLMKIIKEQNPQLVERVGEKALQDYTDTWVNMVQPRPGKAVGEKGKIAADLNKRFPNKICCQSGKCRGDKTKCGFGGFGAMLIAGVVIPELDND